MIITGLITEYNPFHNGHLYHLEEARKRTGADFLVAVMSGDFVQRGAPAAADKFCRTRMALLAGADLVLELPVFYACGSAEYFASGAVSLLDSLGCVDFLCFGSECGELSPLMAAADALSLESPDYQMRLRAELKSGKTFPAAREAAFLACQETLPESGVLSSPNNLLGIEYLKALSRLGSSIRPVCVKRIGDYHSQELTGAFSSASAIRHSLSGGKSPERLAASMPPRILDVFIEALKNKPLPSLDDYSQTIQYLLLKAQSWEELSKIQDFSPELARRMFSLRGRFVSASDFAAMAKSKQYTLSRIRRCLAHLLLDIRAADVERARSCGWNAYARVLGFRKSSGPLLAEIKKKSALPLITKLADAPSLLTDPGRRMLDADLFASSVWHMTDPSRPDGPIFEEQRIPLVLV